MGASSKVLWLAIGLMAATPWSGSAGECTLEQRIETVVPGVHDLGSGCSSNIEHWQFGGINGNWLAVGQPNTLNRRDRVVMRFDLAKYLAKGKVNRAELSFSLELFGRLRQEELQVEHFNVERQILKGNDLISIQTHTVSTFSLDPKITGPRNFSFDVTAQVNRDLRQGFGSSTFRLISQSAEKFGNPFNAATGATVINGTVKLSVVSE